MHPWRSNIAAGSVPGVPKSAGQSTDLGDQHLGDLAHDTGDSHYQLHHVRDVRIVLHGGWTKNEWRTVATTTAVTCPVAIIASARLAGILSGALTSFPGHSAIIKAIGHSRSLPLEKTWKCSTKCVARKCNGVTRLTLRELILLRSQSVPGFCC